MAETNLPARLVEIESMLDRSRRRFEEGTRLVEDAHKILGEIQQVIIGSPRSVSPEDSEEAASRLLASLKATGSEMPETLCGGRLSVDQVQRLIRIDGHPIGITEMEYRVLELLAFARNNVVTRQMLLKHLYRRADDQPQRMPDARQPRHRFGDLDLRFRLMLRDQAQHPSGLSPGG